MADKKTINIDSNSSGSNIYYHKTDGSHSSWHNNDKTNSGPVYGEKYPGLGSYQKTYDKDGLKVVRETIRDENGNVILDKKY